MKMTIKLLSICCVLFMANDVSARPVTISHLHDYKIFTSMIYENEPHSVKFTNAELSMYTGFIHHDSTKIIAEYLRDFNGDIQTDEELGFMVSTHLRNYLK